jgi:hypothetical protein
MGQPVGLIFLAGTPCEVVRVNATEIPPSAKMPNDRALISRVAMRYTANELVH